MQAYKKMVDWHVSHPKPNWYGFQESKENLRETSHNQLL